MKEHHDVDFAIYLCIYIYSLQKNNNLQENNDIR